MKKIFYAIALFMCGFSMQAYCQTDNSVLTNVISKLKTFSAGHINENVYLHFDKPYYAAGDTMYYKAYVTLGEHHDLSKLSGVLHVDLIGQNNAIVKSEKLQLVGGLAWGDFTLSRSLPQGNYRVRAYTKYMENAGNEYFFNKKIAIGSVKDNSVAVNTEAAQVKPDIQFFPEGGNFVAGIKSKMAFKAIGPNGLGVNVKGVIVDNNNKESARFESAHLGMGSFLLLPEADKTYKAKLTYADGSQATVDLPKPEAKGIILAVVDSANKFTVEVIANKAYMEENLNKDINLVIYAGGLVNTVKTKLDNPILAMDVKKDQFPSGVAQVTLFSQTGQPLSERLVFLQNDDMSLAVNSDKKAYNKEDKVIINVNAKTKAGNTQAGHFSVSVTDETIVPFDENNEHTILTDLLLTSSVKGYIEQPNYYFINPTNTTRGNLDALMLTQGYRRFAWNKLMTGSYADFTIPAERGLQITGIAKTTDGQPLVNKSIIMRGTSDASLANNILGQQTDAQGAFKFENLAFKDTAHFVIQSETVKGKPTMVTIDGEKPALAVNNISWPMPLEDVNAAIPAYIENARQQQAWSNNARSLKNVNINTKANYRSSNISGSGNADQVIKGDDLKGYGHLSDALNGILHGGYVQMGVPYLSSSTTINNGTVSPEPMLVIVDGVSAEGNIDNYTPSSIETIEILKNQNASMYGIRGSSGVMVITTRQNMQVQPTPGPGTGTLQFSRTGFYKAREFYSPKYENFAPAKPDLRSTIFWKPELVTDKDGNVAFDFYNGDNTGTYRVVIEGIDEKGNMGRQVYRYKVE